MIDSFIVWLSNSDAEARDSPMADGDAADTEDTDNDSETEAHSSDDEDAGDVDELLDEALDRDIEEDAIHMDSKSSVATDSAAAAATEPVSCICHYIKLVSK